MSRISTRETNRTAKRSRPSSSQPPMAPPVLFRLPSVSAPLVEPPSDSSNASTMNAGALSMSMGLATAATPAAATAPAPVAEPQHATQLAAAAIAEQKAAGQRLLNVILVIVLLAALVVITWISLQAPATTGDMAEKPGDSALEQLGDLQVPQVQTGQPISATELTASKQPESASDLTSGLDLTPNQAVKPADNAQPETSVAGLDLDSKTPSGTVAARVTTPSAQVQLRPPVPMSKAPNSLSGSPSGYEGSSTLVQQSLPDGQSLELDLAPSNTTPAETVSTPAIKSTNSVPSLELPEPAGTKLAPTETETADKPRTATNPGASPSLWDGAQQSKSESVSSTSSSSAVATTHNNATRSSGLTISEPLSANVTVPQATLDHSPSNSRPATTTSVFTKPSTNPSVQSQSSTSEQAVTVGGGEGSPYNLASTRTTSTPDFDPVATIQQYQNYAQQQRLTSGQPGATTAPAGSPAPTTKQPISSFAIGADTGISGQKQFQNPYVKGSAINSYVASGQVPSTVTGPSTGAYVPGSSPSTSPSNYSLNTQMAGAPLPGPTLPGQAVPGVNVPGSMPGQMVSGPNATPTTLPNYQVPSGSLPPRTQPAPAAPQTQPYGQPGPYVQPGAYGQPGTGYPNPSYSTPANVPSGYSVPGYSVPGANNLNPGNARPSLPGAAVPGVTGPNGYQAGVSYPVTPATNGVPTQPVMMGPTGYATAPSGDFAPPRSVTGTMGSAISLPNGIQ